ncbi:response regulator [Ferrovibrio sp.]|uniref:response regulator n=1 Tax=Ferrovibrio sp. TaxID=1917215 RepID=UPI001B3CC69D|nr:response regulator [Ferrovibrio sp.]MBP7063210.1 response regulator [Ferrovibrio sp.]
MAEGAAILVIDDEPQIRRYLRVSLEAHDFRILEADSAREGLRIAALSKPDLIILDLGLPDMDGQAVIARLREWSSIPVIVLSVRADEADKIAALDAGADDYVTKPFGTGELLARIRAALRHMVGATSGQPVFATGGLRVDLEKRLVSLHGEAVKLSPKEYDLLRLLVQHAGKVLTHQFILRQVWGQAHEHDVQYLRVFARQLRQKIEADPARPQLLLTEPGVGYRLSAE